MEMKVRHMFAQSTINNVCQYCGRVKSDAKKGRSFAFFAGVVDRRKIWEYNFYTMDNYSCRIQSRKTSGKNFPRRFLVW